MAGNTTYVTAMQDMTGEIHTILDEDEVGKQSLTLRIVDLTHAQIPVAALSFRDLQAALDVIGYTIAKKSTSTIHRRV